MEKGSKTFTERIPILNLQDPKTVGLSLFFFTHWRLSRRETRAENVFRCSFYPIVLMIEVLRGNPRS